MDIITDEALRFSLGAFRASAALFYWIDDNLQMEDAVQTGLPEDHLRRYHDGMIELDPLSVSRLTKSQRDIGVLSRDRDEITEADYTLYCSYLRESRVTDVMDLIFWHNKRPFAGLGIHKTSIDPPFCTESLRLAEIARPYLQFNLLAHTRLKPRQLRVTLTSRYSLTPREIEIADLVRMGYTNHDIAEDLRIALGTVKTHVFRIFEKLGVENRAALVNRLTMLETSLPLKHSVCDV